MDLPKFWPSSNVLSKVNFLIHLGGVLVSSALLGSLRRLILISNIYNNPTHDVVILANIDNKYIFFIQRKED